MFTLPVITKCGFWNCPLNGLPHMDNTFPFALLKHKDVIGEGFQDPHKKGGSNCVGLHRGNGGNVILHIPYSLRDGLIAVIEKPL